MAVLLTGLASLSAVAAASGDRWSLQVSAVDLPALADPAGGLEVITAVADPRGRGLVALDRREQALHLLPWEGPAQRLTRLESAPGSFGAPLGLAAAADGLVVIRRGPPALSLVDADLQPRGDLPRELLTPDGLTLLGSRLLAIGSPVMAVAGEEPRWADRTWLARRRRDDCRLFSVDLAAVDPVQEPALCGPDFDTPTGRVLRGGHLLPSTAGDRVYAVLEARPSLLVFDRRGVLQREVSYLAAGESFVSFSDEEERAQYACLGAAIALRDRLPWPVGLLRFRDAVGILFRLSDGETSRHVIDLFDPEGVKLADDIDLGIPLRGYFDQALAINLPDGRVMVLAKERSATGEILSQRLFEVGLGRPAASAAAADASQAPGPALRFRLLDAGSGEPVARAKLFVVRGGRTVIREIEAVDGAYAVTGLGAGAARIAVEAGGYLSVEVEAEPADDLDLGTLLLDPGASVRGTLLHAGAGSPLEGARVEQVRRHRWGSLAADHFGFHNRTETDAEGSFLLRGLEEGQACLRISHPDLAPAAIPIADVGQGDLVELGTLMFGEGSSVTGRVVDGAGEPLAAVVELRAGSLRAPCLRLEATADAAGRFRFPAVGPGRYHLAALLQRQIVGARAVEVRGTGREESLGTLRTSVRPVVGQVRLGGEPAVRDWVTVQPVEESGAAPPVFMAEAEGGQTLVSDLALGVTALPDGRGSFEGRGFLPAGEAVVTYRHPDGTLYRSRLWVPPEGEPVTFSLDLVGAPVEGRVLHADGEPAAGARVELLTGGLAVRETGARADGGFLLPAVPPGEYRLRASDGELAADSILLVGRTAPPPVELVMATPDAGSVVVEIAAPSGVPLRGAVLLAGESGLRMVRPADGSVTFPGLPLGRYQVVAFVAGGLAAASPVDLRSRRHQVVRLETGDLAPVRVQLGEQHAGDDVSLVTGEGFSVSPLLRYLAINTEVDLDGWVVLPDLSPGPWRLRLSADPSPLTRAFEVRRGEPGVDLRRTEPGAALSRRERRRPAPAP